MSKVRVSFVTDNDEAAHSMVDDLAKDQLMSYNLENGHIVEFDVSDVKLENVDD